MDLIPVIRSTGEVLSFGGGNAYGTGRQADEIHVRSQVGVRVRFLADDRITRVTLRPAAGALTLATLPAAGDTFTVGAATYTARAALTGAAAEVLLGANPAAFAANLAGAIMASSAGGQAAGTTYGNGTVANPAAIASVSLGTSVQVILIARYADASGNAVATTTTSAHASFGAATLTGGEILNFDIKPQGEYDAEDFLIPTPTFSAPLDAATGDYTATLNTNVAAAIALLDPNNLDGAHPNAQEPKTALLMAQLSWGLIGAIPARSDEWTLSLTNVIRHGPEGVPLGGVPELTRDQIPVNLAGVTKRTGAAGDASALANVVTVGRSVGQLFEFTEAATALLVFFRLVAGPFPTTATADQVLPADYHATTNNRYFSRVYPGAVSLVNDDLADLLSENGNQMRDALDLGTAAQKNTGTAAGDVPVLGAGGTLPAVVAGSDVAPNSVTAAPGSASAPGFRFAGNNAGVYSPGVNVVALAGGGGTLLSVSASTNTATLGIWGADQTIMAAPGGTGNVDRQGVALVLAGGQSVGAGAAGKVLVKVTPPGASGPASNAYQTVAEFSPAGLSVSGTISGNRVARAVDDNASVVVAASGGVPADHTLLVRTLAYGSSLSITIPTLSLAQDSSREFVFIDVENAAGTYAIAVYVADSGETHYLLTNGAKMTVTISLVPAVGGGFEYVSFGHITQAWPYYD